MAETRPDTASHPPRRIRSWTRIADTLRRGGQAYQRWRSLPRLVAVGFTEIDDFSSEMTGSIIARLDAAIARERRRARTGHWSYDCNRHIALLQARRGEMALLRAGVTRRAETPQAAAPASCRPAPSAKSDIRSALLTGMNAS